MGVVLKGGPRGPAPSTLLRSMKTSALSTKSQSRFAIVVLDVVLGSCRLDLGNPDSVIVSP